MKRVDASEFIASKRTIVATKLGDKDEIIAIFNLYKHQSPFSISPDSQGQISMELPNPNPSDKILSLVTKKGFKLKFSIEEIPSKKKSAVGVRGMKLETDDELNSAEILELDARMKIGHRDSKGKK